MGEIELGLTPPSNYRMELPTNLASIIGVTPNEIYAMKLMTFDHAEHIRPDILQALINKGYAYMGGPFRSEPKITRKAESLLNTLHY